MFEKIWYGKRRMANEIEDILRDYPEGLTDGRIITAMGGLTLLRAGTFLTALRHLQNEGRIEATEVPIVSGVESVSDVTWEGWKLSEAEESSQ